jgi:hypothetical protein
MKKISRHLVVPLMLAIAGGCGVWAADSVSAPVTSAPNGGTPGRVNSSWLDDVDSALPVHFALFASETYDDNIFLQPRKTYDYVSHIAPSLSYILGDPDSTNANYLSFFYQPTFLIYANTTGENTVEQNVNVLYAHTFTKLRLGIQQQYQKLADATVDADDIVKRSIYTTTATADYDYDDRLSFHLVGTQTVTNYDDRFRPDTNEWTVNAFFLYDITPKLKLGFGPEVGFLDEQYAPNQTYEQLLAHLTYQVSGKTTITLTVGGEDRQYQYGPGDVLTPVFDLRADYQATDATSFYIDGHAETYASSTLAGQNYQDTSIQGGVRQRFLQKFFVTASGGYDHSDYRNLTSFAANQGSRIDDYFFGKGTVAWIPNDWLDLSASYQYSTDSSSQVFANFNDNQYTLACELKY